MHLVFNIDINMCIPTLSMYVHKNVNLDKVRSIMLEMVPYPRDKQIMAILMPYDPQTNQPLPDLSIQYEFKSSLLDHLHSILD